MTLKLGGIQISVFSNPQVAPCLLRYPHRHAGHNFIQTKLTISCPKEFQNLVNIQGHYK